MKQSISIKNSPIMFIIAICATVLSANAAFAATSTNLISNPSVEDASFVSKFLPPTLASPIGWNKDYNVMNFVSFSYPVAGYNSPKAVKVKISRFRQGQEGWYFNRINILPNTQYNFSDYFISDTTSYITATFKLSNGTAIKIDSPLVQASAQWAQATETFTSPANAVSVTIEHYLKSVGSLTTDAYSLTGGSTVADTTPPVITLNGNPVITVTVGSTYTDAGATASDNVDGNITSKIVTVNPVDASKIGTYTVTYNVSDATGNKAAQVTREVDVIASTTGTDSTNLIPNPLLENGTNAPDSWSGAQWGTNDAVFNYPVAGYTGKGASITITNYTSGDAKWYFGNLPVTAGKYYVFSDKYKSTVPTQVVAQLVAGDGTLSYQEIGTPGPSSTWQDFQAGFNVPLGITSLSIFHLINSAGTLTTDNYSLIQTNNPNSFGKGMVSLSFDDGWQATYDNGISILNAAGIKSTQYIISQSVGDTADGYMTLPEIISMQNAGHDIAAHTRTHPDLTASGIDLQSEIAGSRSDLLSNFKPVDSFAYPYGRYNATIQADAAGAGFVGARTVDHGFNDKSTNPMALTVQIVERGGVCGTDNAPVSTFAQIKNWIDTAAATNTWLILVFHQVDNVNANCYGDTPAMLQNIVNYLKTSNVDIVTVSEGLHDLSNAPVAGDTVAPVISSHNNISTPATSPSGATVNFTAPSVTDNIDTGLTSSCSSSSGLESGLVFPIGDTTITCTATDTSGNSASPTNFKITVTP